LDAKKGELVPNDPSAGILKPGAGPRHLAFHPNGHFVYVINELNSTMTTFRFDGEQGKMTELQNLSTLPEGFSAKNSPAEVYIHPSGKFLYGSNRGHDSIVVYSIAEDGKLTLVQHQSSQGKAPRHFAIDPSGRFLYAENQETHNIVAFTIDEKTGQLAATGQSVEINSPSCLVFYPAQ
jgi:6-phosphogluconolactonase